MLARRGQHRWCCATSHPTRDDFKHLDCGQHVAALFHAEGDVMLLTALKASGVNAWSYEFIADLGFPVRG
jgi:hypothetical protein